MRDWTQAEDRWLATHAGDGAEALASLLDVTTAELIGHALDVGIDIPPRPLMGQRCVWCGHRVTPYGKGWQSGLCEACYQDHLADLRAEATLERRARRRNDMLRRAHERTCDG